MRPHNFGTFFRAALVVAVLSLASSFEASRVYAQGGRDSTGTGGIHTIQGRVFYPSGRTNDGRATVELETSERGNLSTLTGGDGSFRFSNLLAGSYSIVVDGGSEFEVGRESVYIDRDRMSRTVTVPIYLRYKNSPPGMKPGVLDAALASVPKSALEQYEKGMIAAQSADSNKAIECFNRAIAIYPEFGLAHNELGVQYLKTGQAGKATDALRAAVRLSPGVFSAHLNYGVALLNKGKFAEAEAQLRQALKINDAAPTPHMYLGIALVQLRKYDEAESELQRAVTIGKNEVSMAHKYLGGIYWSKKDYKRAADELEKYLELSPKAPDAERVRGTVKELRSKS